MHVGYLNAFLVGGRNRLRIVIVAIWAVNDTGRFSSGNGRSYCNTTSGTLASELGVSVGLGDGWQPTSSFNRSGICWIRNTTHVRETMLASDRIDVGMFDMNAGEAFKGCHIGVCPTLLSSKVGEHWLIHPNGLYLQKVPDLTYGRLMGWTGSESAQFLDKLGAVPYRKAMGNGIHRVLLRALFHTLLESQQFL